MGAAAAQGGLKGRRIKGLILHPPALAGSLEGAPADMGLFWGGVREGSSACLLLGEGTVSLPAVKGTEPRAWLHAGPLSCLRRCPPAEEAAHRLGCLPATTLALFGCGASLARVGRDILAVPGSLGRTAMSPSGGERQGPPRGGSSGPCSAGVTSWHRDGISLVLKTCGGCKAGHPLPSPSPWAGSGMAWPRGLQAGRGGHGSPTPASWQGKAEPGLGESEPRSSPQPENMNNSANICGAGAGEPSQGSSRPLAGWT